MSSLLYNLMHAGYKIREQCGRGVNKPEWLGPMVKRQRKATSVAGVSEKYDDGSRHFRRV